MKREKVKNKTFLNYLIFFFRIVSIIIIVICLYILYLWDQDNRKNNTIQSELSDTYVSIDSISEEIEPFTPIYTDAVDENGISIEQFDVDFNLLAQKNPDSLAWIRILDTNISYPIVQTTDNDFYLTHNIEKQKNGAGWIYADYRNNFESLDKNIIIYGHNRRNGTMFSNLQYYLDENFCANPNHKYFNFITKSTKYLAEVFSVYKISSNKVDLPNTFTTLTDFEETINGWKNNSIYDFQTDINLSDNILSLYTCDNNTSYRIILHAKLIPLK